MITKSILLGALGLIVTAGLGADALALEPKTDYFYGTWIVNGTDCADVSAEFTTIYKTGAVQTARAERVESAGIWELKDDMLQAHLVSSPSYFADNFPDAKSKLEAFEGEFFAYFVRVVPFNIQPDRFDAIGILEDQVARASFQRCSK